MVEGNKEMNFWPISLQKKTDWLTDCNCQSFKPGWNSANFWFESVGWQSLFFLHSIQPTNHSTNTTHWSVRKWWPLFFIVVAHTWVTSYVMHLHSNVCALYPQSRRKTLTHIHIHFSDSNYPLEWFIGWHQKLTEFQPRLDSVYFLLNPSLFVLEQTDDWFWRDGSAWQSIISIDFASSGQSLLS